MAGEEESTKNPANVPVLDAVCDERSRRIEQAVTSLKETVIAQSDALRAVCNDHEHRLQNQQQAIDGNSQILKSMSESKKFATNRAMLYVAIVAIVITFLSNLDKIAAALK